MSTRREKRMQEVLSRRRFDLAVVLENVWDPHNISAVLRSCDATGVQDVYVISSKGQQYSRLGKKSSASASKWLSIYHFSSVEACFDEVRKHHSKIYSTKLSPGSSSLYDLDLTPSIAFVFGNEKDGVSEEASTLSDGNFLIPQAGMIESLNISVACAVALYECFRQRMKNENNSFVNDSKRIEELYSEWKKKG